VGSKQPVIRGIVADAATLHAGRGAIRAERRILVRPRFNENELQIAVRPRIFKISSMVILSQTISSFIKSSSSIRIQFKVMVCQHKIIHYA
jgi:hypothetical protein